MKEFASTVYFYSPKAYKYLRKILILSDKSVLRKMIGATLCEAGFLDGVFNFLKQEKLKSDYVQNVDLIIDGMSIRSNVSTDQKENRLQGSVDYGSVAKELNIS